MLDDDVALSLSRAEALVLFEWLARFDEAGIFPFDHPAEQKAVWMFEGKLEKALTEVLAPEYELMLRQAREDLLGSDDSL
ncbi:hypothetical protein [Deinococcus planocerae]|uniref:hypothetical protein n=1 Tax=Deinococcus planocerae TaxID=1737569 RepID=UPI000C7F5227|nr:hypothetical protein [Deinococcus planocerae]